MALDSLADVFNETPTGQAYTLPTPEISQIKYSPRRQRNGRTTFRNPSRHLRFRRRLSQRHGHTQHRLHSRFCLHHRPQLMVRSQPFIPHSLRMTVGFLVVPIPLYLLR